MVRKFSDKYRDGSFSSDRYLADVNSELSQLGEHGKQVKLAKKLIKGSTYLLICYSHPTQRRSDGKRKQITASVGKYSGSAIAKAAPIAIKITHALIANSYDEEVVAGWLGRPAKAATPGNRSEKITFDRVYQLLNKDWERKQKYLKNPRAYYSLCHVNFKNFEGDFTPITLPLLLEKIDAWSDSHIKLRHLNKLINALSRLDASQGLIKAIVETKNAVCVTKAKRDYVPDDREIVQTWLKLAQIKNQNSTVNDQRQRNLRLYGILAIYGIRIHEAWHILNWDTEVLIRNNEFVQLSLPNEEESETVPSIGDNVIPAINDPNNPLKLLVIGDGKTGKRVAMPCMPADWFTQFDLHHPFKEILPIHDRPFETMNKGQYRCTGTFMRWMFKNVRRFSAHKLRHACNIRMHQSHRSPLSIANSLGHTLTMNQQTYLKYQSLNSKVAGITQDLKATQKNATEIANLKAQLKRLESERDFYRSKYIEAQTELNMIKAAQGR